MRPLYLGLTAVIVSMLLAVIAPAGLPDPATSEVWCISGDCQEPIDLFLCPHGDGEEFHSDAVFGLILRDAQSVPVGWFPGADVFLSYDSFHGGAHFCRGPALAIADQEVGDETGFFTISGLHIDSNVGVNGYAGGADSGSTIFVSVQGTVYLPAFPVRIVSPDIDGDGFVNLQDIGLFAVDLLNPWDPELSYRSDFDRNGQIDLADIGEFALHLGHGCP